MIPGIASATNREATPTTTVVITDMRRIALELPSSLVDLPIAPR